MKLGIDAMGGDFAPDVAVAGSAIASLELPSEATIYLIGDEPVLKQLLAKQEKYDASKIVIVHAPQVIEMGDHPAKAFQHKPNSSIAVGFGMLQQGKIDVFASAGNTGAMMVGTMYTVKAIPGVIRPCISAPIAKLNSPNPGVLLDVGLNADCKPDVLYQYAVLGSIYSSALYGIEKPRVALLNIGEEEEKGNLLTKATFELMKGTKEFNFIGNIESNKLFWDNADVIVCDGFTGNVILKQSETLHSISKDLGMEHEYFEHYNYENHGGTVILGVNKPVIIAHGMSNQTAIKNMILQSMRIVKSELTEKIKQAFQ